MIYYFRQPDKNKEEYELYSNTSLTKIGEVFHYTTNSYFIALKWIKEKC